MRKIRFFTGAMSVLMIFALTLCFFGFSAYAADAPAGDDPIVIDEPAADDPAAVDIPTEAQEAPDGGIIETVPDIPTEPEQTPTEPDADSGDGGNGYDNVIDDIASSYTEPEHLNELPTAAPNEVVEATAVVLPDVEVSDASLFSGIVMWLCVAVGIAVVIGVMVSKRTHRRGL